MDLGSTTCVSGYCQEDCETTGQCVHGQVCSQEQYRGCLCKFNVFSKAVQIGFVNAIGMAFFVVNVVNAVFVR